MTAPSDDLVLDPTRCALLLVDLQNAFCHPDGARSRAVGAVRAADSCDLPRRVRPLIQTCRAAAVAVWWTAMEDSPRVRPHVVDTGIERLGARIGTCAPGSWDTHLVDELADLVDPADRLLVKHRASSFHGTDLERQLTARGIDVLVVAGTTTSYCVESTIRDAYAHDFGVVVVGDCTADTDPGAQAASLAATDRFHGRVTDLDRLRSALGVATP